MESFKEYLTEHIKSSGITWKHAGLKLNVPYNTLRQWKDGTATPPEYVQDLIKEKVKQLF